MKTVAPFTNLTGTSFNLEKSDGLLFVETVYSREPILTVPEGNVTFWLLMALLMSIGLRLFAFSASSPPRIYWLSGCRKN